MPVFAMTANPVSTTADLFYALEPEGGVRVYQYVGIDPPAGERVRSFELEAESVVIENVRGKEDSVSLDTTGFKFYKHTSKLTTFDDDEEIRRVYFPESIELIKRLTGASRVVIYDHIVRRRRPGETDSPGHHQPISQVHIDQTVATAMAKVNKYLPAPDVPKLLKRRFQIINLWRPIAVPALDWPLALCDCRSFDLEKDTFPVVLIFPDRKGETLGVRFNKNHKWKYLHGMTPEEFILIKCADTIRDGSVAISAPHTGFSDPTTPDGTPLRQSIELRALVFYD